MFEMKTKDKKDQTEETVQENNAAPAEDSVEENYSSELNKPMWSVVSFEKVVQDGLTYDEALQKMQELIEQKTSGLCIITDSAAQNIIK